jgi:hypothetical protein
MLQYERDKEGEEFADKEKFVTGAYKKQMEEVRKAEEDERLKEGELEGDISSLRRRGRVGMVCNSWQCRENNNDVMYKAAITSMGSVVDGFGRRLLRRLR